MTTKNTNTTTTLKMTKKDYFNALLSIPAVANDIDFVNFINHELELLDRKSSSSRNSKKSKEREELKIALLADFEEMSKPVTITEFMQTSSSPRATLSNQKLTSLCSALVKEDKLVRIKKKKKGYFALPTLEYDFETL